MAILHDIQKALVADQPNLSSILIKLRLLASRLGSNMLEEWVKHEADGYPNELDVPPYRIVDIEYTGYFVGSFGRQLTNVPIAPYLIEKHADKKCLKKHIIESAASVNKLIETSDGTPFVLDAANLSLVLQGKIYEGFSCLQVKGHISLSAFIDIQQAIKSRILELTLRLEKEIPAAAQVTIGSCDIQENAIKQVQHISQQVIFGNVETAVTGGQGANINLSFEQNDSKGLIDFLINSGIPQKDATELAKIMEKEQPSSKNEPFGEKTKKWITSNIKKATTGTWNIGISVATQIFTQAALRYYGLV